MSSPTPLNGLPLGGNTEGGRLNKEMSSCAKRYVNNKPVTEYCCSPYRNNTVQPVITSNSGNRTSDLTVGCNQRQGVSIDRVQALLRTSGMNYPSETARLMAIQQRVIACAPTNLIPVPIIIVECPPLPAPPAPPARACPLTKNQKY